MSKSITTMAFAAALLFAFGARAEDVEDLAEIDLVTCESETSYFVNTTTTQWTSSWTGLVFNDPQSQWQTGAFGLGYGAGAMINTTVSSGIHSVFTRTTFQIDGNPSSVVRSLFLGVDYDDGFVAFINGVEVLRRSFTGAPNPTASASSHESSNSTQRSRCCVTCGSQVDADITAAAIPALQQGVNVLAIGIWNTDTGSSDLALAPRLQLNRIARGPYLQSGTADSITVHWRTLESVRGLLRMWEDGNPTPIVSETEPTPRTEHIFTVTGLEPNTRHDYAISAFGRTPAAPTPEYFFLTPPPTGAAVPTRIWVLGDSGDPAQSDNVRDGYFGLAASEGNHTDLWLMLGDNAYNEGLESEYTNAVFEVFPEMLRQSVLWPTVGNHEMRVANSSKSFGGANPDGTEGPYFDAFDLPGSGEAGGEPSDTEAYYSFDFGNIHFLSIDSHHYLANDATHRNLMLDWITDDLDVAATTPGIDWVIAFFHHPPYTHGSHNSDLSGDSRDAPYNPQNDSNIGRLYLVRKYILPRLEAGGVDLVLTGHSHVYERSVLLDGFHTGSITQPGPRPQYFGLSNELTLPLSTNPFVVDATSPFDKTTSGTVYVVAGSSSRLSTTYNLDHRAMVASIGDYGSLVLDVNGGTITGRFVNRSSAVLDTFVITKPVTPPPAIFVDGDVAASGNGTSWATAYKTVQEGLADSSQAEVWVAGGTYTLTSQSSSFVIPNGKQVYAGFAGTETTREERDPEANPTILSGDVGGNDTVGTDIYGLFDLLNRSDNAYHVVEAIGVGGSTTLDGFIVTGGNATGAGIDNSGGGIYVSGTLAVTNCFVTGNRAVKGGGVFTTGGSTTLTNCVVARNRTTGDRGGGIYSTADGVQVRNSTVAHNIAMWEGGGIATVGPMTQINIYNSVFWGNVHIYGYSTEEAQIWPAPGLNFPAHTCIEGISVFAGNPGNIGSNPDFVDIDGADGLAGTLDDDFRLSSASPCLDVGNNGLTSATTDIFLHPRVSGGAVDMGAFELEALPVLFVKTVPSGSGDGSSWANASTLQNALAQQDDVEIWVAAGTHKPGAARTDSFVISGGKRVYGGFAGVETARSQRNPAANLTVLSGDLNGDDTLGPDTNWDSLLELANITDNSQHVVIAQGTDASAILDGFTVQSGYADPGAANTSGGGLLLLGPLTVSHCVVRNNHAVKGGGAAALGVPATFTDCLVTFNKTDNLVTGGGDRGGGIFSDDDLTLINCTVVYNTAKWEGGGVASIIPSGAQKLLTVTNCVFWGSTHIYGFSVEDAQCLVTAGKHAVTETCIQGLNLLSNPTNIGSNPLFINAAGNDFTIGTTDDNYRLQASSPCRNNGSNAAVVGSLDLDNTARIKSTIVDMGAYESP